MYRKRNSGLMALFLLISSWTFAQTEPWPGTWTASSPRGTRLEIRIGQPEKGLLYPASLLLECDSFRAVYDFLLVRKSIRTLAISRNKYAVSETPFSLGNHPQLLNGLLDISRDLKGNSVLRLQRPLLKAPPARMPDSLIRYRELYEPLLTLLRDASLQFTKTSPVPWHDVYSERVLQPTISPAYFGLSDTIFIPVRDGLFRLSTINRNDVVSAAVNGRLFADQTWAGKKSRDEELLLDTGLNILVLFTEEEIADQTNRTRMELEFGKKKFKLDFARKDDSAARFIAVKLYYEPDKNKERNFQEYNYPGKGEPALKEKEKLVGSVMAVSKQLTLALWDDAVEDGDTISVNINGEWIAKGFPVKKIPQFLQVTLKPGTNTITFLGDNLGSIPPNTAVLEIIDGKKRKSFLLESVPGESNLLKIRYDVQGP